MFLVVTIFFNFQHPDLSEPELPRTERIIKNRKAEIGYLKISRHYKWALTQVFEEMKYDYAIVAEGQCYSTCT